MAGRTSIQLVSVILQIEFEKGDPRDPINFSRRRKWAITLPATFFTFLSGAWPTNVGYITWTHRHLHLRISCHRLDVCSRMGIYGSRPQLHHVPSHHRVVDVHAWVLHRTSGHSFFQRRVWEAAAVSVHRRRFCAHAYDGCTVSFHDVLKAMHRISLSYATGPRISKRS